jgi:hypothetical protein
MRFIETAVFTSQIKNLLRDDEYRALQSALMLRAEQGSLIKASGGLRKLRWRARGSGKRGGIRVIYFWDEEKTTFYMLFAYPKASQDDLNARQLRFLRRIMREELK